MSLAEPIRVFVGADRSQQLAVHVLENSIRRHTKDPVEVIPMVDLELPIPIDPRNRARTGFSFSRFCIPKLAAYRGRAIYMDADMQVFKDIRELWDLPFDGRKVLIQKEVKHLDQTLKLDNAPQKRIKQCAVMLLDCERLDWDIDRIVAQLDRGDYDYEKLMYELCIVAEEEIGFEIPFEWNSLEHFDANTRLIHYTDMGTQPWVSTRNPNAELWLHEVRQMLQSGLLSWEQVQAEIQAGYFRPSLLRDIRWRHRVPGALRQWFDRANASLDRACGYVPHKAVYEAKRARNQAVTEYERRAAHGNN